MAPDDAGLINQTPTKENDTFSETKNRYLKFSRFYLIFFTKKSQYAEL